MMKIKDSNEEQLEIPEEKDIDFFGLNHDIQPEEGENLKWILDSIDSQIRNPKPEFGPSVVSSFCKKWRDVLNPLKMLPSTQQPPLSFSNAASSSKQTHEKGAPKPSPTTPTTKATITKK